MVCLNNSNKKIPVFLNEKKKKKMYKPDSVNTKNVFVGIFDFRRVRNNEKLKLRRLQKNVKTNLTCDQEKFLCPIFTGEVLFLYPNDYQSMKIHYGKANKS